MKLVVNNCFGGFGINQEVIDKYELDEMYLESHRDDAKLIEIIESGVNCDDDCSKLEIVEILDDATDYAIMNYDGKEYIVYTINGKLKWAYPEYE